MTVVEARDYSRLAIYMYLDLWFFPLGLVSLLDLKVHTFYTLTATCNSKDNDTNTKITSRYSLCSRLYKRTTGGQGGGECLEQCFVSFLNYLFYSPKLKLIFWLLKLMFVLSHFYVPVIVFAKVNNNK